MIEPTGLSKNLKQHPSGKMAYYTAAAYHWSNETGVEPTGSTLVFVHGFVVVLLLMRCQSLPAFATNYRILHGLIGWGRVSTLAAT
jgi:hypothetical protein